MNYETGMLLSFKWDTESYGVCKVVKVTQTNGEPLINIITYSNGFEKIPDKLDPEQLKPLVTHMPMTTKAMDMSECAEIGSAEVNSEELKGYERWVAAWRENRAGYFERPIPDAVNQIIEAMGQVDSGGQDSVYRERLMRQWQKR